MFCLLPGKGLNLSVTSTVKNQFKQENGCVLQCMAESLCYYAVWGENKCYLMYESIRSADVIDDLGSSIVRKMKPYQGKSTPWSLTLIGPSYVHTISTLMNFN